MSRNYNDFIKEYLDYAKNHESTQRIQLWAVISILAGALERKVWIDRGYYTLYANLYVFIIGKSGLIKKSTSTAIAVDLLRSVEGIKFMSERLTAAALIDQMTKAYKPVDYKGERINQSPLFAYASEAVVFLGEVFGSVIELLTTFYDCQPNDHTKPWVYNTRSEGRKEVYGPCLNILGASTKAWLKKCIPDSEMEGGFTSRCLFVVEDNLPKNLVSWPEVGDDLKEKRLKLIEDLTYISELTGPANFLPETRLAFKGWYEYHMRTVVSVNKDPKFSGYLSRKGDLLLKLALIRSVSLGSSLVVTPEHFAWAGAKLELIEPEMMSAFKKESVYKEDTAEAIKNFIKARGGRVKKGELTAQYEEMYGAKKLNKILFSMVGKGELLYQTDGIKQFYETKE